MLETFFGQFVKFFFFLLVKGFEAFVASSESHLISWYGCLPISRGFESIPIDHISIGHHQPRRPVPRGFSLFKRCEWLVSNRAPFQLHTSLIGQTYNFFSDLLIQWKNSKYQSLWIVVVNRIVSKWTALSDVPLTLKIKRHGRKVPACGGKGALCTLCRMGFILSQRRTMLVFLLDCSHF